MNLKSHDKEKKKVPEIYQLIITQFNNKARLLFKCKELTIHPV